MSRLRLLLYWIVSAVFLAAVVMIIRSWVPDWSYITHDDVVGITGFWVYWLGSIAIAFSVVIIFLLVYLILLVKEQPKDIMKSVQAFWKEYEKVKKRAPRKTYAHKKKKLKGDLSTTAEEEVEAPEQPEVPPEWEEEEFE